MLCAPCDLDAVWGQSTAQIHGTVRDSSGSVVPGAEVKATQTNTGVVRSTTSEADGSYVLPALPVGPYRLEIAKDGFTKAVQSGIVLQVNTDPAINVALKVGSGSEQVLVQANAALVETRSSGIGKVVQIQRIGRHSGDLRHTLLDTANLPRDDHRDRLHWAGSWLPGSWHRRFSRKAAHD